MSRRRYRLRDRADLLERYLRAYPWARKWVNQCVSCQRQGPKPDMPDCVGHSPDGYVGRVLRGYADPLPLDERGLCPQCAEAVGGLAGEGKPS